MNSPVNWLRPLLTCYDDVCIDLQLNRKSASQDLPTHLTGKIVTVLERSGLTHRVFCQKKKRFLSCHNCLSVSAENLYSGWMTYLPLLTLQIPLSRVSFPSFCFQIFFFPLFPSTRLGFVLVVTWRMMGKETAVLTYRRAINAQHDPVGASRCRLSVS